MAGPPDAVRLIRPVKRRTEAAEGNKKALSRSRNRQINNKERKIVKHERKFV